MIGIPTNDWSGQQVHVTDRSYKYLVATRNDWSHPQTLGHAYKRLAANTHIGRLVVVLQAVSGEICLLCHEPSQQVMGCTHLRMTSFQSSSFFSPFFGLGAPGDFKPLLAGDSML